MSKVSVIMPTHNSEKTVKAAIESVQKQTFEDWELIIIDDASKDSTIYCIHEIEDNRIRLLTLSENIGAAGARNYGLERANGRYVAFLDSDDLWHPQKLELQLDFMEKNDVALCFSSYYVVDKQQNIIKKIDAPESIKYKNLLGNTIIGCLTVVIDVEKTGYFKMPNYKGAEDTATWLDILKKGYCAKSIKRPLAYYRKGGHSLSSNKLHMATQIWRIYREHLDIPFIEASLYFMTYTYNGVRKNLFR